LNSFNPALILLYALFPLVFKGIEKLYSWSYIYVVALILLFVIAEPFLSEVVFYLFAIRFPIIIIGIATYLAVRDGDENSLLAIFVSSAVIGFCLSGKEMLNGSQTGMLALPLILYGLSQLDVRFPAGKFVEFCGLHSLEIYLAQNIALNQFYANFDNLGFIVKTVLAVLIIVAGSAVLYLLQTLFYKAFSSVTEKWFRNIHSKQIDHASDEP